MKVIPAIYPESFEEIADKLYALADITKFVQIIICDGSNGMRKSWDPTGILPDSFDYEFDLDLLSWKEYVIKACKMTSKSVVVHVDTFKDEDYDELLPILTWYSCSLGLTISNLTPVDVLIKGIKKIESNKLFTDPNKLFIQVSGVKNENGDNRRFDESVISRIHVLKKMFPKHSIQVSGRVNPENAGMVISAGADRIVSSSYIFGHENLQEAINNLLNAVASAPTETLPTPKLTEPPLTKLPQVEKIPYDKGDNVKVSPAPKYRRPIGEKYEASKDPIIYIGQDDDFLKED